MFVKTIAHTGYAGVPPQFKDGIDSHLVTDLDLLVEIAGRNCYQSWNRPNPATALNRNYIGNILNQGHYSVLEHASVTFYIDGVSTALLGQLSRHRHLSLSVESARYVDKTLNDFVDPEIYATLPDDAKNAVSEALLAVNRAYNSVGLSLRASGSSRKEANQAARFILPQGIETKIVVTGNLRAWREFLQKRLSPGADEEIRKLSGMILDELRILAPNCFQDFE